MRHLSPTLAVTARLITDHDAVVNIPALGCPGFESRPLGLGILSELLRGLQVS
jgi:hypothetical protein